MHCGKIFDEIVRQCIAAGLVAGKHLSFDGTVIQANASYESMVPRRVVEMSPAEYIQKIEQENPAGAGGGTGAAINHRPGSRAKGEYRLYIGN
ncbi:MAG: Transposase IS4 family protein [Thermoanaerobacterales bacterium 50_218]|nr:MAG: Transposase IS4 family protein [Thermoanaerobacterales bacterium 50_218]